MVSHLNRSLSEFDIETFDEAGTTILQTRPLVLLNLIADWIDDKRFENFAELVRHPDLFSWVSRRVGSQTWLSELDLYQNDRLPFFVPTDPAQAYFEGKDRHGEPKYAYLKQVHAQIAELVNPLLGPPRPLNEWAEPWKRVLETIYEKLILQRNEPIHLRIIQACQKMVRCLIEFEQADSTSTPEATSVEAINWMISLVGETRPLTWPAQNRQFSLHPDV